jgi:hypothetical protein
VKRIAIILGIAAAIGAFPSVAQNENRRVAQNDEVRSYTTISNIMKTKHETVKNSLSNIR